MARLRDWVRPPQREYEPIAEDEDGRVPVDTGDSVRDHGTVAKTPFSWIEYLVFLWLGVAMLWPWNMFLAAAPYFEHRFESSKWVASNFQSCIISVFCVTSLLSMLILAKLQENASYPRRIRLSLVLDIVVFVLLALSTVLFRDVSVGVYFAFLLVMNFGGSLATGINQNGAFAYVSGFDHDQYVQAIMGGQGVAGVLPPLVQILSVLAVPAKSKDVSQASVEYQTSKSAFAYFAAAVGVAGIALLAFIYLDRRSRLRASILAADLSPSQQEEEDERTKATKASIPLLTIFKQVHWMALAVFICFAVTMVFPVFTTQIRSVHDTSTTSRLFEPDVFVPLAFLFWNIGDLMGRFSLVFPSLSITAYPFILFVFSIVRVVFIPLYLLCNVRGQGAVVKSDAFYLFVVQLLFGVTNGYIGSSCMMGAVEWVATDEKEATGAFMALMLVAGLTAGSLLSFFIGTS